MICIILGLVPPCLEFWQELQANVTSIPKQASSFDNDDDDDDDDDDTMIDWIESCTAVDTDTDDNTLTLLVSAWTTAASPEHVCQALDQSI